MRGWVIPVIAAALAGVVLAGQPGERATSAAFSTAASSCAVPATVKSAQVIMVSSSGTHATLTGCTRNGGTYRRTVGPFAARVGYNGVARPGTKREGDGRTPSGTFGMGGGFGTARSPGVALGWLRVGARDVWVDDPGSRLYNTHQRLPAKGRWHSAERLRIPAYRFAQVVRYNTEPIPGRGSAIFLHTGTSPTAGCVALPTRQLVKVLRWEGTDVAMVIS